MSDDKKAKPIHLLSGKNYTTAEIRNDRYKTCIGCEKFFQPTKMCKECGCFMGMKTWLKNAECPIGLWHKDKSS